MSSGGSGFASSAGTDTGAAPSGGMAGEEIVQERPLRLGETAPWARVDPQAKAALETRVASAGKSGSGGTSGSGGGGNAGGGGVALLNLVVTTAADDQPSTRASTWVWIAINLPRVRTTVVHPISVGAKHPEQAARARYCSVAPGVHP